MTHHASRPIMHHETACASRHPVDIMIHHDPSDGSWYSISMHASRVIMLHNHFITMAQQTCTVEAYLSLNGKLTFTDLDLHGGMISEAGEGAGELSF